MDTQHQEPKIAESHTEHKKDEHQESNKNSKKTNEKVMAVLAYIGILVIIPLLVSKKNPFVTFHVKQGLVLLSITIIIWALGYLMLPIWFLYRLVDLGVLILAIMGIINVANNKQEELPLVGQFAKHFKI
jgi:uncharacterized membrane protein